MEVSSPLILVYGHTLCHNAILDVDDFRRPAGVLLVTADYVDGSVCNTMS